MKFSSFADFIDHIGPKPAQAISSIELTAQGIETGNVRWVTRKEKNTNRRLGSSLGGASHTISEWERIKGWRINFLRLV